MGISKLGCIVPHHNLLADHRLVKRASLCCSQVTYVAAKGADSKAAQTVVLPGQCCFDTIKGHLCVATASSPGIFGCVMPPRQVPCCL